MNMLLHGQIKENCLNTGNDHFIFKYFILHANIAHNAS